MTTGNINNYLELDRKHVGARLWSLSCQFNGTIKKAVVVGMAFLISFALFTFTITKMQEQLTVANVIHYLKQGKTQASYCFAVVRASLIRCASSLIFLIS